MADPQVEPNEFFNWSKAKEYHNCNIDKRCMRQSILPPPQPYVKMISSTSFLLFIHEATIKTYANLREKATSLPIEIICTSLTTASKRHSEISIKLLSNLKDFKSLFQGSPSYKEGAWGVLITNLDPGHKYTAQYKFNTNHNAWSSSSKPFAIDDSFCFDYEIRSLQGGSPFFDEANGGFSLSILGMKKPGKRLENTEISQDIQKLEELLGLNIHSSVPPLPLTQSKDRNNILLYTKVSPEAALSILKKAQASVTKPRVTRVAVQGASESVVNNTNTFDDYWNAFSVEIESSCLEENTWKNLQSNHNECFSNTTEADKFLIKRMIPGGYYALWISHKSLKSTIPDKINLVRLPAIFPSSPTNVKAVWISSSDCKVQWDVPAFDGGCEIKEYSIGLTKTNDRLKADKLFYVTGNEGVGLRGNERESVGVLTSWEKKNNTMEFIIKGLDSSRYIYQFSILASNSVGSSPLGFSAIINPKNPRFFSSPEAPQVVVIEKKIALLKWKSALLDTSTSGRRISIHTREISTSTKEEFSSLGSENISDALQQAKYWQALEESRIPNVDWRLYALDSCNIYEKQKPAKIHYEGIQKVVTCKENERGVKNNSIGTKQGKAKTYVALVTGLIPGSTYAFWVSYSLPNGIVERSIPTGYITIEAELPDPPQHLITVRELFSKSEPEVLLKWSPPSCNGGTEITGYQVAAYSFNEDKTFTFSIDRPFIQMTRKSDEILKSDMSDSVVGVRHGASPLSIQLSPGHYSFSVATITIKGPGRFSKWIPCIPIEDMGNGNGRKEVRGSCNGGHKKEPPNLNSDTSNECEVEEIEQQLHKILENAEKTSISQATIRFRKSTSPQGRVNGGNDEVRFELERVILGCFKEELGRNNGISKGELFSREKQKNISLQHRNNGASEIYRGTLYQDKAKHPSTVFVSGEVVEKKKKKAGVSSPPWNMVDNAIKEDPTAAMETLFLQDHVGNYGKKGQEEYNIKKDSSLNKLNQRRYVNLMKGFTDMSFLSKKNREMAVRQKNETIAQRQHEQAWKEYPFEGACGGLNESLQEAHNTKHCVTALAKALISDAAHRLAKEEYQASTNIGRDDTQSPYHIEGIDTLPSFPLIE